MADHMPAKPSRLWRMVLVISLGLNLLVIGFGVGLILWAPSEKGGARGFELGPGPLSRALAPQERRDVLRDIRDAGGMRRGEMREYMQAFQAALLAVPFDADALQVVMSSQRQRLTDMQDAAQSALFAQIVAMTPERRAEFAAKLAEGLSRARPGADR